MSKSRFDDEPDERPGRDRTRRRRSAGLRREIAAFDPALVLDDARRDRVRHSTSRPRADAPRNAYVERALTQRLEGAEYHVEFRDDDLYVDGVPVGTDTRLKLARLRGRADWARDDAAFARLVEAMLPDILLRQVRNHARAWDAAAVVESPENGDGFSIRRRGLAVAQVRAGSFITADGRRHNGQYWACGKHWNAALSLLPPGVARPQTPPLAPQTPTPPAERVARTPRPVPRPAARRVATPSVPPPQRRIDPEPARWERWPGDASPKLTAIAVAASGSLRDERVRVDEFAAVIDCRDGHVLTFEPLRRRRRSGVLELPYDLRTPGGTMWGHVYLKSSATPLAIHVAHRDEAVQLIDAWALMLQVAEARYCSDPDVPPHENPGGFIPDGSTRELRRHWVSAHRVRLPAGRRPGVDAIKAAEAFDIDLPDGFTWRSGHFRGLEGSDAEPMMRYAWHRPPVDPEAQ
ncbi:hypothetical protein [Candidatus Solirubrobacter pratensis]|uniref:hypothetical protein n=1 Tax=Candidatus Solirubrobacter pratensis TaxID=1298857 RepID=UPI0012DFA73C|nr:hypothetical protein [Candidatus Solirubrobacter pratensis]